MRTNQTVGMIAGLALGVICMVAPQPGGAAAAADGGPLSLDLSSFQKEKFVKDGETNAVWQSLVGRQVYDGLPFLIEGQYGVYGKKMGDPAAYPDLVGIPIGREFQELHLLHYCQWSEVEGRDIALVRLNYADGSKDELPIRFGGHVRDWERMAIEEKELLTDANTKVIWRGPWQENPSSTMRLFKSMLANPHPEKAVATMDVVSARSMAEYVLVAATVANHDASRQVTPPCPTGEPERHFDGALTVRVTEQGTGHPVAGALVQPRMEVDGAQMSPVPVLTSAAGESVFAYPAGRTTRASVAVEKETYGSYNTSVELEPGATNRVEVELRPPLKVTGVVRDAAGAALGGVELSVWPQGWAVFKETATDAEGKFILSWSPVNQYPGNVEPFLIARDMKRNLALAQSIDEDTTNVDLRLEPGLTLAGRALGPKGKALTNAEARLMFWSERMGGGLGKPTRVDAEGKFEIKALPVGRRYAVDVTAKGYGRVSQNLGQDAEGRRIELELGELALADQRIAGVVLDADEKPVAYAHVQGHGEGQPQVAGRTDSKGRFSFREVCAGPITLFANAAIGGEYGNVNVEGGDTNVTVHLGVQAGGFNPGATAKITGTVADPEGKPAAKVLVSLFPSYGQGQKQTDGQGRFTLSYNPNQFNYGGPGGAGQMTVIARDSARNLAAALDLEEGATNASVRLQPAVTLAGRITDSAGKAITNAYAQVMLRSERMSSSLGSPVRANAQGRFEVKGLPPGRRYTIQTSAKGFGQEQREVAESESATNRLEVEAIQLVRADLRIAGVVVDADDKPVAHVNIYGHGERQPAVNGITDGKGRFSFAACPGTIQLNANTQNGGYGNVSAEGGDTNVTLRLGVTQRIGSSARPVKITGTVTDPEGKPAARVRVAVYPSFSQGEKQTDAEGRFTLSFNPGQYGPMGASQPIVIARDLTRNLAVALDLEEGATNANVRLVPAITLSGRITDTGGKAVTNGQARVMFLSGRMYSDLGAPARCDGEGRFTIKGLPPERQFNLNVSAKGFGQEQRNVSGSDTGTNWVELEPFELALADQRIAGMVVDGDDKPVSRAWVNSYGQKQPNMNTQTDAKGHFAMEKVCAGPIQLSANSQRGTYGMVTAEGGDTNIVIRLSNSPGIRRSEPPAARLKGKPLPDLGPLGLTAEQCPSDQPLLAVLIDAEQRPSRRALRTLGEQAAAIKEKGVGVVVVQTGTMSDEDFKAWKQEAAVAFPIGCLKGDAEKFRAAWGARALPWLILTDKAHRVTAEGFALEELEAKLKELSK